MTASALCSCVDAPNTMPFNYCEDGEYQNCSASRDAGDCLPGHECESPIEEAPDTYIAFFEGNTATDTFEYSDGYVGEIDKECHSLGYSNQSCDGMCYGGDVDWIQFKAKPGTPLTITVERALNSLTSPIALLHASNGAELIYCPPNDYDKATLSFLAPEETFYLTVEEFKNYNFDYVSSCKAKNLTGGIRYHYVVKAEKDKDFVIRELGKVSSKKTFNIAFTASGQAHYYKVKIKKGRSLSLDVHSVPNTCEGSPVISPIIHNESHSAYNGGFSWSKYGAELIRSRSEEAECNTHVEFDESMASCEETACEYFFVITDYNGVASYEYELTVTSE